MKGCVAIVLIIGTVVVMVMFAQHSRGGNEILAILIPGAIWLYIGIRMLRKNPFHFSEFFTWLRYPGDDPDGERLEVDDDGNFTIYEKNYTRTKGNMYKDGDTLRRHGYRTNRISRGTKYSNQEVDEWLKD